MPAAGAVGAGQGRAEQRGITEHLETQKVSVQIPSQDLTPSLASKYHGKNWSLSILLLMESGDR